MYASCTVAPNMDAGSSSGYTDNYSRYGTKSYLQIRSIISIVNHDHILEIMENTFTSNSGTKGIIYLDMMPRTTYPVFIGGNTFT
jgi:hypothetical protein